jgi:hypothetical protein
MASQFDLIWQLLHQFFVVVVLVFAGIGFAVGVGLIVSSARTLQFFHAMNRWISMRGALKPMEIPRDTEPLSHGHRRSLGYALVAGGAFSAFGLAAGVDAAAVGASFARGDMVRIVAIAAGALRWFLIVGSVAGVAVGLLLLVSPDALAVLEKHANRWVSSRRAMRGADDLNLTLDRLVETHPGPSGWILVCTTLGAAAYAATLL